MNKFGLNSAHAIAKILLYSKLIKEDDLISTIHNLMDGNIPIGAYMAKKKAVKKPVKKKC